VQESTVQSTCELSPQRPVQCRARLPNSRTVHAAKPGAPFLIYLYDAFGNSPPWYKALWAFSNGVRVVVSRLPHSMRKAISETIAALVFWILARLAALLARLGVPEQSLPLSWYSDQSFSVMRTDAYDRF
jgi:hypothetical protein